MKNFSDEIPVYMSREEWGMILFCLEESGKKDTEQYRIIARESSLHRQLPAYDYESE